MLRRFVAVALSLLMIFSSVGAVAAQESGGHVQIAAGGFHTLVLTDQGNVLAWGYNKYGQLGDGTTRNRHVPTNITYRFSGYGTVVQIAAGGEHTLALTDQGKVLAWGRNNRGQLGANTLQSDGTLADRRTPTDITNRLSGHGTVVQIAAGGEHTLALTDRGKVLAWGDNVYGKLGDGTTSSYRHTPTDITNQFSGYGTVVQIAAGDEHTLALTDQGNVLAWGYNYFGQLGDGTTTNRYTPTDITHQFSGYGTVVQIAAGRRHTLALTDQGKVLAWGLNNYGQLGDGTTTNRHTPTDITHRFSGYGTVVQIVAGDYHTLALTDQGKVLAWGYNSSGRLGDGTTTNRHTPTDITHQFSGYGTVVQIAAGGEHTLALTDQGNVLAWGYNVYGQLGDGTTTNRHVPRLIFSVSSAHSGTGISIKDVPESAQFVLTGSDGLARTFVKDGMYGGRFVDGPATHYPSGEPISWSVFPAYAVAGSGSGANTKITLKPDLRFVSGNGLPGSPYAPEPAGAAGHTGSASVSVNVSERQAEASEAQASELAYQNSLLQTQLDLQQKSIIPTIHATWADGRTIAQSGSTVPVSVFAQDSFTPQAHLELSVDNGLTWIPYSSTVNLTVTGSGYRTFAILVRNALGNVGQATLSIFVY